MKYTTERPIIHVLYLSLYGPYKTAQNYDWLDSTENCKLGHDCRRVRSHSRHDTTQLDSVVGKFVQTRRDCRRLSATQYTPLTPTRLNSTVELSLVGVGGVYWALASLPCSRKVVIERLKKWF